MRRHGERISGKREEFMERGKRIKTENMCLDVKNERMKTRRQ